MNIRKKILGGIFGSYEEDYESETRETTVISSVTQLIQEIVEAPPEKKSDTKEKFSSGSISFKEQQAQVEQVQKQQTETDRKKDFFQTLLKGQERFQRENDRLFEEEISDIISNLPTEQKNRLLHYQASYKDKSIYQRAELRKKLIEEKQKTKKQEKAASIPNPSKQSNAMETAFEGGSGKQGSGSANLSAQAIG